MLTGVPQGSVLGPLLFFIYINDIYNSSKKLSFYLFADDTNLLYADKDLKSLESVINIELQKVCDWLNANKLTINAKKSNFVIFRPSQKKLSYQINIQYRPNVSYHLSSRFSQDASRFSRDESRFSQESLNRLVWNILLARGRCTIYCIRDFRLHCVVKSVKSKLKRKVCLFSASSY